MSNEKIQDAKLNFLYKAIEDAQQAIRFIDTKASILFLFFGIFVSMIGTGLPTYAKYYWHMPRSLQQLFVVMIVIFLFFVTVSIVLAIKVIFPRSNPSQHIKTASMPKEIFYIYKLNSDWKDCFIDRNKTMLQTSFEDYFAKYKEMKDEFDIEKELIHELLKVSYIRELKIMRLRKAVMFGIGAIFISLILVYLHFHGLSYHMPRTA